LFEPATGWSLTPERFRLHADAVAAVARRIAREVHLTDPDVLVTASLLHDCGELVLVRMYPAYQDLRRDGSMTPVEKVSAERRELGIDHALVGGVLLRRWALPGAIAAAVERHHARDATGLAGLVALADMIEHYEAGDAVDLEEIKATAERAGLNKRQLGRIMFGADRAKIERPPAEPSPLSARESDALRGLVEGKVYKEIAVELGLSVSTVRSHLHNVYKKLGATDRAQAVLMARDRGWV
jgi:putative nucleotidyltransferase with HDIG domain